MKRVIFILTFIPVFILYVVTSPSTVFWQDSGIYLSGIKDLGIVYPPGFPLYILSSWLWVKLLTPFLGGIFTYAKIVHLYSGLWGALTASLVSVFTYEMIRYLNFDKDKSINNKFAGFTSVGAGLFSGVSYSLWAQSINAEVYSLAGFLAISVFYIIFRIYREVSGKKGTDIKRLKNDLILLAFCWGISYAVHPLTVSFAPVILYLFYYLSKHINISVFKRGGKKIPDARTSSVYQNDGKSETRVRSGKFALKRSFIFGVFVIFFISAVTFYAYLPVRSAQDSTYLWNKIDSPRALFDHIIGKEYFTREVSLTLFDKDKFFSFFVIFWEEYLISIPIFLYSFWILAKKRLGFEYLKFIFIYAISIYAILLVYEGGSEYKFWLIPFYSMAWTFVGYGMYQVQKNLVVAVSKEGRFFPLGKLGLRMTKGKILSSLDFTRDFGMTGVGRFFTTLRMTEVGSRVATVVFMGVLLTLTFSVNWKYLNRSSYTLAYEFGVNLLKNLPEGSVLFTIGDQSSSIPQYVQYVENYRTDIALVWDTTFSQKWKRDRLKKKHPDLIMPRSSGDGDLKEDELFNAVNDFIRENIERTDIFLITRSVIPVSDEFGLVPAGTFWKVVREVEPVNLKYWDIDFSDKVRYNRPEKRENARQIKDQTGVVTSIVTVKFSDEAKDFELQAYKNLADYCLMTFESSGVMEVVGLDGKLQTWGKEELLLCSQKYYEKMYETDPLLNRDDVYLNLERVREGGGKI